MEKLFGYLSVIFLALASIIFLFFLNNLIVLYLASFSLFLGLSLGITALLHGFNNTEGVTKKIYLAFLLTVFFLMITTLILYIYNLFLLV